MQMNPTSSLLLALFATAAAAHAQTITVTTSADVVDVPIGALLADLPGPDGVVSFREALRVSDNLPGQQTIGFAVPMSDWQPGVTEYVVIQGNLNWPAWDSVVIDGTTQTAVTGDTNPDGSEVGLLGWRFLNINGDGSVVRGLHASQISLYSSQNLVEENTGKARIDSYFSDGNLIRANDVDTLNLSRSHSNVVVGNTLRRIRINGHKLLDDPALDNRIGGPNLEDRNFVTGWGNHGEHGTPAGDTIELIDTERTVIENNYIGTTPDGMAIGNPASTAGIHVLFHNRDLTIRDNLIATRAIGVGPVDGVVFGSAVYVDGEGSGLDFRGNTVGLNALGEPLLGGLNGFGVHPQSGSAMSGVRIGGPSPGEGNTIAGHLETAVLLVGSPGQPGPAVRVSGNSIHSNGGLGIDLTPNNWTFGPTPNDAFDPDTGASGLQNHPELTTATLEAGGLRVAGTLSSSLLDSFTVEFFASSACGASGQSQAEVFLGSTAVATDFFGEASFDVLLPTAVAPTKVPIGWVVTATATLEPVGATSELSACVPVGGLHCQPDLGYGGPGTATLSVCGDVLASGGSADLALLGAPAGSPAWIAFGMQSAPTPLLGGTLLPMPPAVILAVGIDASGEAHLPLGGGVAVATTVYAQAVVLDLAQPDLFALTNAVGIEMLP